MGLISAIVSLGGLLGDAKDVSEVFVENKTKAGEQQHEEFQAALEQLGKEFGRQRLGWFDGLVDGLNRLPRPAMALGTLGLFGFAMVDPIAFSARMQGLSLVPDPLWWLLGAVVSFYFGARELHHFRSEGGVYDPSHVRRVIAGIRELEGLEPPKPPMEPEIMPKTRPQTQASDRFDANPALEDWIKLQ